MVSTISKTLCLVGLGLALSLGLSTAASNAEPALKDKALYSIRRLQPSLTYEDSERIAVALIAVREDGCGLPWEILLSVAFTESSLRREAMGRLNSRTLDYGLMQINAKTITLMGLSKTRLMVDERYAVAAGCAVLEGMRDRYAKHHSYWIGFYRAGTAVWKPSTVRIAKGYHKLVMARAIKLGYRR